MFTTAGLKSFHSGAHSSLDVLLAHLRTMHADLLVAELSGFARPNICDQIFHTIACEISWVHGLQLLPMPKLTADDYTTVEALAELKRRMQAAHASLKHELGGLRTGRASASLLEPVQVEAYGQRQPINQVASITVPESRALSVSVWDKSMVQAVDKAIRDANLGLSPTIEGSVLRIRIPELNEQRRKEMAKIAHKYSEDARVAVRHVRRDGIDILKKLLKERAISEDDEKRHEAEVQKVTDQTIEEIDSSLAAKEKEIMQV